MEVSSERDKSQLSSSDTESFSMRSIQLGRHKRKIHKSLSSSCERLLSPLQSDLLASISRKLQVNSIQVYSKKNPPRLSDPYHDKAIAVSCFPQLPPLVPNLIEYSDIAPKTPQIVEQVHGSRGCTEQPCPIKRKWLRNIIFYERELKNALLLRERIGQCPQVVRDQIDRDVGRSFADNLLIKTKIAVSQLGTQKHNLLESLRGVLRLYSISDPQVGYVQGMNLIAAAVVLHAKQVSASFVCFRQIMGYGQLRKFYISDFELLKAEMTTLERHLHRLNLQLWSRLDECNIDYIIFLPFYLTLFASFVDIQYMHIIIDQYMKHSVNFLHRFMLIILLKIKNSLLEENPLFQLGNSQIKSLSLNWEELLEAANLLDLQ